MLRYIYQDPLTKEKFSFEKKYDRNNPVNNVPLVFIGEEDAGTLSDQGDQSGAEGQSSEKTETSSDAATGEQLDAGQSENNNQAPESKVDEGTENQ